MLIITRTSDNPLVIQVTISPSPVARRALEIVGMGEQLLGRG